MGFVNKSDWARGRLRYEEGRCLSFLSKAEPDNTNRGRDNSSYPTGTKFNNCFII